MVYFAPSAIARGNLGLAVRQPWDVICEDLHLLGRMITAVRRHHGDALRALRFGYRTVAQWPALRHWCRAVWIEDPTLSSAPEFVRTLLVDKLHRPFARKGLSPAARRLVLERHYAALGACFPAATVRALMSGYRFPLASMVGARTGREYLITLSREVLSQHQGELSLLVLDPSLPSALTRLHLNLAADGRGRVALVITGMQSARPEHKTRIVEATRDLHGLRPKQAVLEAAFALAEALGAHQVIATALDNHVSQSKRHWRRKIHADYDGFWSEFATARNEAGDFILSRTAKARSEADVPAGKRSQWRRRHGMIESLRLETVNAIAHMACPRQAWRPVVEQTLYVGRQSDGDMEVLHGRASPWIVQRAA